MAKTFRIEYQAPGSQSGLTVNATCKDETHTEVVAQSGVMTEDATTGKYYKDFVVDNADWSVQIGDSIGGKAVKHFGKPEFDAHGIEAQIVAISGAIGALNDISSAEVNTEVDTALADYDGPTKAEIDATESNIRGADSDTLKDISDQIDGLDFTAPPMIG